MPATKGVRVKVRSGMDHAFIYLINIYKRYLSPYKGYSCAHRVLHGHSSCSSYVKNSIKVRGWKCTLLLVPTRAKECAAAAKTIEENDHKPKRRKKDNDSWTGYCLGEVIGNAACCFLFN